MSEEILRRTASAAVAMTARSVCGTSVRSFAGDLLDGRPRVFYGNHGSHLDFVVIWAALPPFMRLRTRPVVAQDYWLTSPLKEFVSRKVCRAIFVDRGHTTRANNPLREVEAAIAAGDSIVVFPEGFRAGTAELQPFKSGLYHIAKKCPEAELVPVFIENLNRMLPKGEVLFVPLLSKVLFGPPIRLEPDEARGEFLERARLHLQNAADWSTQVPREPERSTDAQHTC